MNDVDEKLQIYYIFMFNNRYACIYNHIYNATLPEFPSHPQKQAQQRLYYMLEWMAKWLP